MGGRAFLLLASLFVAALVVCNLIAGKIVDVDLGFKVFTLSVGVLPYPITFLLTDILSEIYGRRRANQVVWSGFAASIFVLGILFVAKSLHARPDSAVHDPAFNEVFGNSWRVIFSSMVAYLMAQLVDIRLFHFWKDLTKGRHLWLRNNASTICSQLLDSTLVIFVLFTGVWSGERMVSVILDMWLFKLLVALTDTPFFYLAVYLFRRHIPAEEAPHTTFG
jgi:uncharacterized integral membrane protein (TIGR00697 family)